MVETDLDIEFIVKGCKQNNLKAQEQLYKSYYTSMMSLCLRYTKNEMDAMEVLNTGFFKVFKNIEKYDAAKASLYTWMRKIIINNCIDFNKPKYFGVDSLEQAADLGELPAIFSAMAAKDILDLIRQLPNATQTVFNLYVLEGYNHGEIAEILSISQGTSKWHLSEARKKLQILINTEMQK